MSESSPIEILLAEDNEDDTVLLLEAFEGADNLVLACVVEDGVEAMAYLRREGEYSEKPLPHLLLLDINMPRKNGFEVLHEIKADVQLRALPIVILTTSTSPEDVTRSYAGGACSFISKPSSPGDMAELAEHFSTYWRTSAQLPTLQ